MVQEVCSGSTGHTEAVQMIFNPAAVSYKELLTVLFDRMDPTALNRYLYILQVAPSSSMDRMDPNTLNIYY